MKIKTIVIYLVCLIMILGFGSCESNYGDIDNGITQESYIGTNTVNNQGNNQEELNNYNSKYTNTENFDGLTILVNRTTSLNPLLITNETMAKALNLVYQNMVTYTEDNKVVLNLLESYSFDSTTNTFDIKIRDNLYWDDGVKININDFIYSYKVLNEAPDDVYYKHIISDVLSFVKIDETSFSVVVSKANTGNPYFLAFPIIPEHKKDDIPLINNTHYNTIVGNGIYQNTNNSINNQINLIDRVDDNIDLPIKNIRLAITDSEETIFYGFEQGLSNVLNSSVSSWSKYHINKSVNINSYNDMNMVTLGFNFDTAINNDKNFRYSVYHAIPFEQIQKSIYLGHCDESRIIYPMNHFAYNINIQTEAFDGLKSYEYLQQTGYNGQILKLITLKNDKELIKTGEIIKANLETLKVKIVIEELEFDEYKQALDDGEFDLYLGNFKMSVLPDYSKLFGSKNYGNYTNESIMSFINNLDIARSYDEYFNTAKSLQSIVYTEKPIIPIVHTQNAIITSKEYQTVKPTSYDSPYQNIGDWIKVDN